jgi:hypothetical protein
MHIAEERVRKGELKMYGLMVEIRQFWRVCGEVRGHLAPGGQLDIEDLDDVIVALDHALVSIRTLDLEVFQRSDEQTYLTARDDATSRQGQTVRALTAPRNSAVHHADVVDPAIASAAGPMPETRDVFLINPRWKPRSELPERMFQDDKGKPRATMAKAYDDACAGLPVLDTLLDAFAFFDTLAPQLARRQDDGRWEGFPLTPYPIAIRYRRLAPDWLTEAQWGRQHREQTQKIIPTGPRTIRGAIDAVDGLVLCGDTTTAWGTQAFTEPVEQVVRDVLAGARYDFHAGSGTVGRASSSGGALEVPSGQIEQSIITRLDNDVRPWRAWWEMCADDAEYYAQQRR